MAEQVKKYKDWKSKRAAELQIDKDPSQWIWFDSYPGYEDWYHLNNARTVARMSKERGLPPALGIAAIMEESGLGNTARGNPGRVNLSAHPTAADEVVRIRDEYAPKILEAIDKPAFEDAGDVLIGNKTGPQGQERQAYIDQLVKARDRDTTMYLLGYSLDYLKKNLDEVGGPSVTGLQNYSGKGNKLYGGQPGRSFGKSHKDLNLRQTMNQGNRKAALWKAIEAHPGFKQAYEE